MTQVVLSQATMGPSWCMVWALSEQLVGSGGPLGQQLRPAPFCRQLQESQDGKTGNKQIHGGFGSKSMAPREAPFSFSKPMWFWVAALWRFSRGVSSRQRHLEALPKAFQDHPRPLKLCKSPKKKPSTHLKPITPNPLNPLFINQLWLISTSGLSPLLKQGQTGSGKTFSLFGSFTEWLGR